MKQTTIRILFVLWVCLSFSCGLSAKELRLATGCVYSADNSFFIEVGNKDHQIGCKEVDGVNVGPRGIVESNGDIYILDVVNYKVNVYARTGQFKVSHKIPNDSKYYNLAVDAKGKIYLLTRKGIYVININEVKKLHSLPDKMVIPYDAYIDNAGNITISGNDGSAIIDSKGNSIELKGSVLLSPTGLLGLLSNDYLIVRKNRKDVNKFKINQDYLLFGFSEDYVYYILPPDKNGVPIRKVDSNGKIADKKVDYDFGLISDSNSYPELFHVTPKEEVIFMDLVDKGKKLKVSIVNFKI